jgi:hypothetical protein
MSVEAFQLPPLDRAGAWARARTGRGQQRALVRMGAFTALAVYGTQRWATMLSGAPTARLLGLVGLAVVLAGVGPRLSAWSRPLAVLIAIVAVFALLPISGLPLAWTVHVRVAVSARAIGHGLSALPRVLLPYDGVNEWVRAVMVMGAGVLLLDAALLLALAPFGPGDVRRAGAALPLVALAVVPSTLVRPHLPYLHGLVLFALLAVFVWGERVSRTDLAAVVTLCSVAGAVAMLAGPAIDRHRPWINYQALATRSAPGTWTCSTGRSATGRSTGRARGTRCSRSRRRRSRTIGRRRTSTCSTASGGRPVSPEARIRWRA